MKATVKSFGGVRFFQSLELSRINESTWTKGNVIVHRNVHGNKKKFSLIEDGKQTASLSYYGIDKDDTKIEIFKEAVRNAVKQI